MEDRSSTPDPAPARPWLLGLLPPETAAPSEGPPAPDALPADALGLALSGGGIRSAAFCLGVLQALARAGWLRSIDFLSTVSGGGYTGAFLGRFFDLCAKPAGLTGAVPNTAPGVAQERVARDLGESRSAPINWLRRHANYLSPTGLGEVLTNLAGFWRNLLSVLLVLSLFLFAAFGLMNAIAYITPDGLVVSLLAEALAVLSPIVRALPAGWAGPWAVLAEVTLWLAVFPLMLAYWLVSQDLHEALIAPVLIAAAILAIGLVVATASPLALVVLAAAVLWVLAAWSSVLRSEGHADPTNRFRLMLARNNLTARLAFWLAVAGACAAMAVVDGLGRWLARLLLEGGLTPANVAGWLASTGAAVLGLSAVLRMVAGRFLSGASKTSPLLKAPRPHLRATLALVVVTLPPLVVLSFASHAAYELGGAYTQGLVFAGVALVVSLLLGSPPCVPFINRSGPLGIYASRLARAFLGAVNPQRRLHPEGRNVTYVVPGDDVRFREYRPDVAGGPLHLVNCAVNETIDVASQRGLRDRQAENFAVGPAGASVGQGWHALWEDQKSVLRPLAVTGPHPFLGADEAPVEVEPLDLREWVAISGAAISPGMGRATSTARAVLLTLANVRLGYWWDSGLTAYQRQDVPVRRGWWPTFTNFVSRWFRPQALLLSELLGRFGGSWYRYWYLSDGGNFEVTGAYELLRRRLPFVIVCDASQDSQHQGSALAGLVRLARVDLGAEVEEVDIDPTALERRGVPAPVAKYLGTSRDLLASGGELPRRHAALLLVRYPAGPSDASGDAWLGRRHTWVLYLKATLTGDEPADLRNYAALHPDFPNESTLDQVFDEPQWESYRKLGEHVAEGLFPRTATRAP